MIRIEHTTGLSKITVETDPSSQNVRVPIIDLDIAYQEVRAALVAMYGKPVEVTERFKDKDDGQ